MERTKLIADLFRDFSTFGRLAARQAFNHHRRRTASHTGLGLLFVLEHDGEQSIKDLAERFGMTSSAATQIVDELERKHFVARRTDQADRRKLRIIITAVGKKELMGLKEKRFQQLSAILEILSNEELAQLYRIERKIVEHLQEMNAHPGPQSANAQK